MVEQKSFIKKKKFESLHILHVLDKWARKIGYVFCNIYEQDGR